MSKVHIFKRQDRYYIFDGNSFKAYKLPISMKRKLDKLGKQELEDVVELLEISKSSDEYAKDSRSERNSNLCHRLILNVTSKCNLACRYCYADEGGYRSENSSFISDETVYNAISAIIEIFPDGVEYIQLFGGEPLLDKNLLYRIVPQIKNIFKNRNLPNPKFLMVTNGTLADDECISFIVENFETITISLDGNKYVNDCNRRYRKEEESVYDRVKDTVRRIKEKDENFIVCCEGTISKVHINEYEKNKNIDDFYSVMKLGFDYFQATPVFGSDDEEISLESIDVAVVKEYFDKLIRRSYYDENGNIKEYLPAQGVYNCLKKKVSAGNGCGASQNDISIDVNGMIYPCFMFIGELEFCIGDVNHFSLENALLKRKNILEEMEKALKNEKCTNCWAEKLCCLYYGHCIGERFLVNRDLARPIELNCELTKTVLESTIFQIIDYSNTRK